MNEVALSVQFAGAVVDEVAMLAKYWPGIQNDFPDHEKQPPLPPMQEDFAHPPHGGVEFQFMQGPPLSRYWFISSDKASLVQVQGDRFALNWRQAVGGETYPRYRHLRPEFERRFRAFLDVAAANGATPTASWCEITYINHVDARGGDKGEHGPLSRILRALNPEPASPTLPPIEDTALQQRFLISSPSGEEPVGRLYLTATPGFRTADASPIYVITLVARGRPTETSAEGVLRFFDVGRELIVKGFKESTTDEMHKLWGLSEES